ncbi:MAG: hypothetical protein JW944_14635 [Deltaproteobacteria bacterium]|nr:hypothetical protein [Deltaproteobacteria bacterium]
MKRYCIICHSIFGCVKEGIKYSCDNCPYSQSCFYLSDPSDRNITSGICDKCWESHGMLTYKEAAQAA